MRWVCKIFTWILRSKLCPALRRWPDQATLFLKILGECLRKTISSRKNSREATTPFTADMHMVERPTRPLPFWERLLRLNLTTVIHRLTCDGMRGDANLCTRWAANGFKYSLRHKSKANLLARTWWVSILLRKATHMQM